jgi:recombination protein RecR
MTDSLHKLQALFKKFPGIGERQAMRFAYFIATTNDTYAKELLDAIGQVRAGVRRCSRCYALAEKVTDGLCSICANPSRDRSLLLVVEKDADRERFVQSHTYQGTYFLLGGLAPAIEKDLPAYMRLTELVRLVQAEASQGLKEVILALSLTPDGTRTESLVLDFLRKETGNLGVTFSLLGRGLSTGTEIEYSDADTLKNALSSRMSRQ